MINPAFVFGLWNYWEVRKISACLSMILIVSIYSFTDLVPRLINDINWSDSQIKQVNVHLFTFSGILYVTNWLFLQGCLVNLILMLVGHSINPESDWTTSITQTARWIFSFAFSVHIVLIFMILLTNFIILTNVLLWLHLLITVCVFIQTNKFMKIFNFSVKK